MRIKIVKRYYCDFCTKKSLSAGHMRRHERHCTKNPARICRVCSMVESQQKPIAELLALLPDPRPFQRETEYEQEYLDQSLKDSVNAALPKLREFSGNCPGCIMAALRQKGIPVPMASDFHFTDEMKAIWAEINEEAHQRDMEACRYG